MNFGQIRGNITTEDLMSPEWKIVPRFVGDSSMMDDIGVEWNTVPEPSAESAVIQNPTSLSSLTSKYFVDDDYGAAHTFSELLSFLHET